MNIDANRKYVIVSNEHTGWPRGALLFWGRLTDDCEKRSFGGYTTRWDKCERYTREELEEYRKGSEQHYPFFDELNLNARPFLACSEVLCTLEELESIGYSVWTVICRS